MGPRPERRDQHGTQRDGASISGERDQSTIIAHRRSIDLPTSVNTVGDIVSSILAYSSGRPVLHVWNRWLRPGSSRTVTSGFSRSAWRSSGRLAPGKTCKIALPDDGQHGDRDLPQVDARVEGEERAEPRRRHLLDHRIDAAGTLVEGFARRLGQRRVAGAQLLGGGVTVGRGGDDRKHLAIDRRPLGDLGVGGASGLGDGRRLQVERLVARHRRRRQQHHELDVGRSDGGDGRDDRALGMSQQADARGVDVRARPQRRHLGQRVLGEVERRRARVVAGRLPDAAIVAAEDGHTAAGERIGEHEERPVARQRLVSVLRPRAGDQHDRREAPGPRGFVSVQASR